MQSFKLLENRQPKTLAIYPSWPKCNDEIHHPWTTNAIRFSLSGVTISHRAEKAEAACPPLAERDCDRVGCILHVRALFNLYGIFYRWRWVTLVPLFTILNFQQPDTANLTQKSCAFTELSHCTVQ